MPPEAPKTEAPKTEQSFDDAFAEAVAADTKAEDTTAGAAGATAQDPPSGDKPSAGNDTDAAAAATEGAAEAGAAAEGEAAAAAVEAAAAEDPAKKAAPSAAPAAPAAAAGETSEQEVARLRAENAALNAVARITDKPAAAEPAHATSSVPAEPKWYQPQTEEVERVRSFAKEWPDIHEAVQALLKQAGYNAAEYVFHTIAKVYNPTLEEFAKLSQTMQEQLTLGALRNEHNDYDSIYDNVVAWVDTLSPAFKRGAQQVMKEGTPEEVNDLIAAYKETDAFKLQAAAHGGAKQAAAPAAVAGAPAPAPAGLSAAAKKAAGKLQVVGSKRTTPVAPADANDFDGAWAEAMRGN